MSAACSELSRRGEAPLLGTVSPRRVWLLLEHPGPWGARATEDNDLPAAAQGWLERQQSEVGARVLFVRRGGEVAAPFRLYLAVADPRAPRLYRYDLADYPSLRELEIAAAVAGDPEAEPDRSGQRLQLICTNARRDRCCARFGVPLFTRLAAAHPQTTWQCTHLGGHRYAATGAWFPEGVFHGCLSDGDAETLLGARERGAVWLDRYRGRSCYSRPEQAAEGWVRRELGLEEIAGLWVEAAEEVSPGHWQVRVATLDQGRYRVQVESVEGEALVSCSPPKRKTVTDYVGTTMTAIAG